jgi:hypothetical protein
VVRAPAADGSERSGALVPGGEGDEPTGTGGRESELLHSTEEGGEPSPEGPSGGKAAAGAMGPRGGKDVWEVQPGEHLNETPSDSRTGEAIAGDGDNDVVASHRHNVDARGVQADPEGRSSRSRRGNVQGVREGP